MSGMACLRTSRSALRGYTAGGGDGVRLGAVAADTQFFVPPTVRRASILGE